MLVYNYELFKLDANESIGDIFTRFPNILNALKNLGKIYSTPENVRKILRSLPKSWEAKDLTKLPLDELVGSLMTHEITMNEHMIEESKKKKRIALKSITLEVDSDDEEAPNEDDVAYFTRKYKK